MIVTFYYIYAINSAIDLHISKASTKKDEFNQGTMGPLRRKDDDEPKIPDIYQWFPSATKLRSRSLIHAFFWHVSLMYVFSSRRIVGQAIL